MEPLRKSLRQSKSSPVEKYYFNPRGLNTASRSTFEFNEFAGDAYEIPSLYQKYPETVEKKRAVLKSLDVVKPKAVIPYFLRLLLTNQVRSKESENAIELEKAELKARLEETEKNLREQDNQSNEGEDEAEEEYKYDQYVPEALRNSEAAGYYLGKDIGRRGAQPKTFGISEPLHRRWSRTVWRRELENLEPEYRLPALILKKHLYIKHEEPTRLGPGTYDVEYENYCKKKKLETTRGIMRSCTRRFPKEIMANQNPGPGAYGYPFGVQDKARRDGIHSGRVSLFLSGPCDVRGQTFKAKGSSLGPGQYNLKGSIEDLLNKRVSTRGPYDLYTPDRLIIPYGYHKTLKMNTELGPGQYNVRRSLRQEMNSDFMAYKGHFSPHNREKKITGERISLVSPLWPVDTELYPGPGLYDVELNTIGKNKKQNKYAFQSSAESCPIVPVDYDMAPTKYRPELGSNYCPLGCGHRSIFKSKTGRIDLLQIPVLSERVRPKDIPPEEKLAKSLE